MPVLPTNQDGSPHGVSQGFGRLGDLQFRRSVNPTGGATRVVAHVQTKAQKFGRWADEALTNSRSRDPADFSGSAAQSATATGARRSDFMITRRPAESRDVAIPREQSRLDAD